VDHRRYTKRSGPINVRPHEALGVIIGCSVPADAQQTEFNATAVVVKVGTQSPSSLLVIKLRATANLVGRVTIVEEGSDVLSGGFLAGETAPFKFIFESTLRHNVTGPFSCISIARRGVHVAGHFGHSPWESGCEFKENY
jgi:hypothetical protein